MDHLVQRQAEVHADSYSFEESFDEIISRKLDAGTLHTYADGALDDLVDLMTAVTSSYRQVSSANNELTGLEYERLALNHFNLDADMVEHTLNHIIDVAEDINGLAERIAKKTKFLDMVIVPPDKSEVYITPEAGDFGQAKKILPKLETLLLILERSLGVAVDSEDVNIYSGALQQNMMRRTSYTIVEIGSLDRLVFSCDEVGNVTFVFDLSACNRLGKTTEVLAGFTKKGVREFISDNPHLGTAIRYSNIYTSRLTEALVSMSRNATESSALRPLNILKPRMEKAPNGHNSIAGMAKQWNTDYYSIKDVIKEIGDQLGEVGEYLYGTRTALGFSAEQQQVIYAHLRPHEVAPKGVLSLDGMYLKYKVGTGLLGRAIEALGEDLGPVNMYWFTTKNTYGYTLDQQGVILKYLMPAELAPAGYLSVWGIRTTYGLDAGTIRKAITEIGGNIGEVKEYRFHAKTVPGYSPKQQRMILEHIRNSSKQAKLGAVALSFLENADLEE